MDIVIQKFGGSSVANVERLESVARRVIETYRAGRQVVVVVSAMANTTDDFLGLAQEITANPRERELDMLLTAGERISMALLSMIIWREGLEAISFTGSQSGIISDNNHTRAKIIEVKAVRIIEELHKQRIVIVAGFQGVSPEREVTTLGRGGSDTTAVALAAALGALKCEIYTDVEGVFTIDPRLDPDAIKLPEISYEMMLELAVSGAKVFHSRAVELARTKGIPVEIKSSFVNKTGTFIKGENQIMETPEIVAISHRDNLTFFQSTPLTEAQLSQLLDELKGIRIETEQFQLHSQENKTMVSFWIPGIELPKFQALIERYSFHTISPVGVVTLVGKEINRNVSVLSQIIELLNEKGYKIFQLNTSCTSLSLLVDHQKAENIALYLHQVLIKQKRPG
ncbi:aspartate kinase [bacterium]|nr:aspartate kinase [bacterium]